VMLFDFSVFVPFLDEYFELIAGWFDSNNTVLTKFNDTGFDYFSVFVNYNATFLFGLI